MDALILGCGEAFDDELPNTSVLLSTDVTLLLDCGFSAAPQVWKAEPGADAIDVIYISHGHADHYFGLPAVLTRMWEDGRTKPLMIVSQGYVLERLPGVLDAAYPGIAARFRYPIEYRVARPGEAMELGGATLRFAETRHAVPNCAVRVESRGASVCYSGDGMFTDASRELFSGADLLIHEAYRFEPSEVHGDIPAVMEMAERQGVRKTALVHVQRKLRRRPERLVEAVLRAGERVILPEPMSRISTASRSASGAAPPRS